MQSQVIKQAHETGGHMGTVKTMRRITEYFVWSGIRKNVRSYVNKCATCQAHHKRKMHVEMSEVDIPPTPMQMLGAEMMGPFRENEQGHKCLLTMIDYLSGWAEAFPMKCQTADELIIVICCEYIPPTWVTVGYCY